MVGHIPVEGWPELKVVEHHVSEQEMRDRCAPYVGPLMTPQACAEFYLAEGECHVWFSRDFPPSESVREHELLHCKGYDHIGGNTLQQLLKEKR